MTPGVRLVATVPDVWRVSRADLRGWDAAERELPRLVRRLIAETVPAAEVRMPAGTGVAQPGWDGIVRCSEGDRFVPDGLSVWELSARTVRRCVLLNRWDAACEGDRAALERFVGCSYVEATEALSSLDSGEAPMVLTGELWHVVSPEDAWSLVSGHLTRDDIESFAEIAHEVLTEPDPFDGMSAGERMLARYEATRETYSRQLRHGVAATLPGSWRSPTGTASTSARNA